MIRTEGAFYPPLYLPKNMLAPVKPKPVLSQLRSEIISSIALCNAHSH